jgi:thioesterase domain-containing protein
VEASAVPFDLTVSMITEEEPSTTYWLRADYRTDLFAVDLIDRLLDHYVALLLRIKVQPEVLLSQLDRPSGWPVVAVARNQASAAGTNTATRVFVSPDPPQSGTTAPSGSAELVEEVLTKLWARALGARPPSITANFFDLGGHSLLAMRLAAEIGRAYGIKLPVSLIFQEPTIEGMARRLRRESGAASSVFSIQQDGTLPPFFCAGSMREFLDLSRALGPEQPFFQLDIVAVQQQRFFADQPLYASVPDLATRFRQDILSIQPTGRYFLGGMCDGGILALEIALQLQAQGHEVALLAQFDTPVNGYWRKRPVDWLRHGWLLIYSGRLAPRIRDHLRASLSRRGVGNPQDEAYAEILRVTWEAIRAYRPDRLFEGEIQIFRAPASRDWLHEDVAAGWRARASMGIRVHDVVGEHQNPFREPHSQRVIASVIERAQRDLRAS